MSGVDTAYAGQSPSITGRNGATRTEQELAPRPTMRKATRTPRRDNGLLPATPNRVPRGSTDRNCARLRSSRAHHGTEGSRTVLVGLRAGPVRGIRMPRPIRIPIRLRLIIFLLYHLTAAGLGKKTLRRSGYRGPGSLCLRPILRRQHRHRLRMRRCCQAGQQTGTQHDWFKQARHRRSTPIVDDILLSQFEN